MNKKILNLVILLVFIFSCTLSTSNNNVDVKPTTSVSSNISVSPTINPSFEINPTPISLPYTSNIENTKDYFNLNSKNDGIENGYDGKVLIVIDTHLLKMFIEDESDLIKFPRTIMILKESYDELETAEKDQLKKEYGEYSIFDRDTYIPLTEGRRRDSTYDGIININILGLNVTDKEILYYRSLSYIQKEDSNKIPYISSNPNFSEKIKSIHSNVKKSNKSKLMKLPIKKITFNSIYGLSQFSEFMYYVVNYTDFLRFTSISTIPENIPLKSFTWNNCIPNSCE
jgi:hypothetical protein